MRDIVKTKALRIDVPPFANIWQPNYRVNPCECKASVRMNGVIVWEYDSGETMDAISDAFDLYEELQRKRDEAERELKEANPTEYWKLRFEATSRKYSALLGHYKQTRGPIHVIVRKWERTKLRNAIAGSSNKPPRRAPLRRAIIGAMRPLRADGLTLDDALRSLTHSPAGALRITKTGDRWHCESEDAEWPPELLTREQLKELFKAAGKKWGSYRR